MRRRFFENKLSVIGLIVLVIMYLMAALAPFLSPVEYDQLDSNAVFASPTGVQIINGQLAICGVVQTLNSANFSWVYTTDCTKAVPISFFVHGYSYNLLGFIPMDLHLFGVPAPDKLYLLGTDAQGRDMFWWA